MSTLTNSELLARLDGAFKAVTDVNELGASVLNTAKFDRFIQEARDATTVLPEARFVPMDTHRMEIDRVGFPGRVLKAGRTATALTRVLGEAEFSLPEFRLHALEAKELQAITSLRDAALRRNIERGGFEDTLVDLFGQAAGRDLEEYAMLADKDIAYATDDVLSQTDGWVKRADLKLYGTGAGANFDPANGESMFESMLQAIPKRYMGNPAEWRIWVSWGVRNSYVDVLRGRGNMRADELQEGISTSVRYKGIPIVYSPGLERSTQPVALMSHPDNMVWGVFHQVTIEPEREAKGRRTDFVLTVEADAGFEDESAAVVAFPATTRPV
jgi:hypothetical protein